MAPIYIRNSCGTLVAFALLSIVIFPQSTQAQVTLFDNGTLVTGVGNGFGSADTSTVFTGHTVFGSNVNNASFRLAEDFTVSGTSWDLTSLQWYGYQTGSTTTSTFTAAFVTIYDGVPGAIGTNVVAGDFTTNRLTSAAFSNIYRVNTTLTDSTRPVMDLNIDMQWAPVLAPGTYWLGVGTTGSLASGPFTPVRAVTDGTSNLRQQNVSTGVWSTVDANSTVAGTQATEASFRLLGTTVVAAPEPSTIALLALGGIGLASRRWRPT
jgi:hypothetical protein